MLTEGIHTTAVVNFSVVVIETVVVVVAVTSCLALYVLIFSLLPAAATWSSTATIALLLRSCNRCCQHLSWSNFATHHRQCGIDRDTALTSLSTPRDPSGRRQNPSWPALAAPRRSRRGTLVWVAQMARLRLRLTARSGCRPHRRAPPPPKAEHRLVAIAAFIGRIAKSLMNLGIEQRPRS